jgi:hypothetical protein
MLKLELEEDVSAMLDKLDKTEGMNMNRLK